MTWDWAYTLRILPTLLSGVIVTVQLTVVATLLALLVGLLLAMLRMSPLGPVSTSTYHCVELIRRTPLLVQIFIIFYALPDFGVVLSPFVTGVLALVVNYAAYMSEVYRAGIERVSRGQWEAARACNLSRAQTWRYVILPQAVPPMIAPLANYFISMFKDTPILSIITVMELMNVARIEADTSYRYLEPMTLVGVFFLIVSVPSIALTRYLERRFGQ